MSLVPKATRPVKQSQQFTPPVAKATLNIDKPKTNPNQQPSENTNNYFQKAHNYLKTNKKLINKLVHYISAIVNGAAFLNGNFKFLSIDEETQQKIGNFFARCTTAVRGITGAVDCWSKNNLIPLIGSALEVPTAVLSNGYTLWLARGIPQSIRQVQGFIKNRNLFIKQQDGKEQVIKTDNFSKQNINMFDGMVMSLKEIGKVIKELLTEPFKQGEEFAHTLLPCSFLQFAGPVVAFFRFDKLGAFLRDFGGVLVDAAYIQDKKYLPAGLLWICSAIFDYAKRITYVEERVNNLTQLSNAFDQLAGTFESEGNFA